jgi:acyl carrier protein
LTATDQKPDDENERIMNVQTPRGIEVLVKKASVDPAFRAVLLERRAAAAKEIGLELDAAEAMMLAGVPIGQLDAMIARTEVLQEHRRAFLGQAAAAMLAALGVVVTRASSVEGGGPGPGIAVGGMMADNPRSSGPTKKDPSEDARDIERRVVAMIAKRFRTAETQIKPETSLAVDLHADTRQLVGLKRQLEKQFKLSIPKKDFEKVLTVGDAVKCVQDAIKRRTQPNPPSPMQGSSGGIRPR